MIWMTATNDQREKLSFQINYKPMQAMSFTMENACDTERPNINMRIFNLVILWYSEQPSEIFQSCLMSVSSYSIPHHSTHCTKQLKVKHLEEFW